MDNSTDVYDLLEEAAEWLDVCRGYLSEKGSAEVRELIRRIEAAIS